MGRVFGVALALLLSLLAVTGSGAQPDKVEGPRGCGGYIRSAYKLEFHQIEIKLYTKQGSLTMKTDCAPSTGYYFIPLERLGEYVLKISPPEGWTFDPPEYQINFDGKTDVCSQEVDLNFDFKGFSVYGQVSSAGYKEGPSGVQVSLTGPHDLKLSTVTEKKGSFSFERIPPGQYVVQANHPDLAFENNKHSFEITNKNINVEDKIRVSGYVLTGKILSDSKPVEGVSFLLHGKPGTKPPSNCLPADGNTDVGKEAGQVFLCHRVSDAKGVFQFTGVSPGPYSLVPVYRGKNIVYTVTPDKLNVEVKHESLTLKTNFQVEGFTVTGTVKGIGAGASVLVNGKVAAKTQADGSFTLAKMKPGSYEFLVQSDKYQFDPVKAEINAANPTIPTMTPSRFLVCGDVTSNPPPASGSLTLMLQPTEKSGKTGDIRSEIIENPARVCVFLSPGTYNAWVGAQPNKFFIPSKIPVTVPTKEERAFSFKQFLGRVSGVVNCNLGCPEGVTINLDSNGKRINQVSLKDASGKIPFSFPDLESGAYRISLEPNKYCWDKDGSLDISLKDSNIENLSVTQSGFKLAVTSSHDATVKVIPSSEKDLTLVAGETANLCIRAATLHRLVPSSCHIFEKAEYQVTPGVDNSVELKAVRHTISGLVLSKEKIEDLKVKLNDELLNEGKPLEGRKNAQNEFEYRVEFSHEPQKVVLVKFISVGFSFDMPEVSVATSEKCQPSAFQIRALKAHIIKGKLVPALDDVQIRVDLLGEKSEPTFVTTNAEGEYIAGPFIHSSGFEVTPTKSGYTFKPLPEDPYSFSVHQLAKIQVKVVEQAREQLLTNVLLSLSGPNAYRQNRYTDSNGEMTFTDLQAGQYYLKALLKEFRFEPSAVNIQLEEQETKVLTVKATRESFSLYGQLFSLNGELVPNLIISAKGTGKCAEYGEDGISDESGNFRIWALKSNCAYVISVSSNDDKVERTIPSSVEVTVGQEDVRNVSFMVMTPVTRMDISLRCRTNKEAYLDSLTVFVYSTRSPDIPLHRATFNGYPFIILPLIPKDGSEYFITFESSLSEGQYKFKSPSVINFVANESFAHFAFDFYVEPAPVEQDIGKSSYIAMTVLFLAIIGSVYFEKILKVVKAWAENSSSSIASGSRKVKVKSK